MLFGDKLRQLMQDRKWSVSDLAQKSGLSFPTVRAYVAKNKAKRLPTLANAIKLATAFGVSLEEFRDCTDLLTDDKSSTSDESE